MYRPCLVLVACLSLWQVTLAVNVIFGHEDPSKNLFKNWDMQSNPAAADWSSGGGKMDVVSGGHTGATSLKVTGRTSKDQGIRQKVTGLKTGTAYYVSFFVKMLNDNPSGTGWTTFMIMCKHGPGQGALARLPFQRVAEYAPVGGYKHIGGDFIAAGTTAECWIRCDPANVQYQVDAASFTEIPKHTMAYYDSEIQKHRTSPLTINGNMPAGCSGGQVKVELVNPLMGFGIALNGRGLLGTTTKSINYQNFFFDNFNWASLANDMKWKPMEKVKGTVKFTRTDEVLQMLKAHNITVRGHTMMWAVKANGPTWVQAATGGTLKQDLINRVKYMGTHFKGKIHEWDVNNEEVHSHWMEEATKDRNILKEVFQACHQADPNAMCMLNDYEIVRNGQMTSMIADTCEYLNAVGAKCDGIGIQSHERILPIPEEVHNKRLQIASRLGVPITVSELSFHSNNVNIRAAGADQSMRIYMANPHVKAMIFWTMGPQWGPFADDYYLAEGDDWKMNAAGQRVMNLITKEWKTNEAFSASGAVNHNIPHAFRGQYKVSVVCGGQTKSTKEVYLGASAGSVNI